MTTNTMKLTPTSVEYHGDARGLYIAAMAAKKHVRAFMKWGELRSERNDLARSVDDLRRQVKNLESQNRFLRRRVDYLKIQLSPVDTHTEEEGS